MNWTVGKKLVLTGIMMIVLSVVVGMAGLYATFNLSASLDFVTNEAWNAADGSMEGSIGLQQQMIAVENIISGRDSKIQRERLKEGAEFGGKAFERMLGSGLFSKEQRVGLNSLRQVRGSIPDNPDNFEELRQSLNLFGFHSSQLAPS